ncbi:MAG: hypothetical protein V3U90_07005, partial [Dehalococcoidia bacterium]
VRNLSPLRDVAPNFLSQGEMDALLDELFQEAFSLDEAQISQEVLVMLDLLDEEDNLYQLLLDLYKGQVLGLYDSETEELYVLLKEGELGPSEKLTYVHEYVHALQDQHFDLESIDALGEDNSDYSLAITALIEGDATLSEVIYFFQDLSPSEQAEIIREAGDVDDLQSFPRILVEELSFPYNEGLNFVQTLFSLKGWEGVDEAFGEPPASTEQIIHPEKYLAKDEPQLIEMPDLAEALGQGWSLLDSDVLGEFTLRIYLETFLHPVQASLAAEGWDGDLYVYLKDEQGRKLLALRSTWDTRGDAHEFYDAYVAFNQAKSEGMWLSILEEETTRWWHSSGLSVYLSLASSDVLILLASDREVIQEVLNQFPAF